MQWLKFPGPLLGPFAIAIPGMLLVLGNRERSDSAPYPGRAMVVAICHRKNSAEVAQKNSVTVRSQSFVIVMLMDHEIVVRVPVGLVLRPVGP